MSCPSQPARSTRAKQRGQWGERYAVRYLQGMGYYILETNWHFGKLAEVDIIAWNPFTTCYHFVEVKTRYANTFANGLEQATPAKQKRLANAVLGYLEQKELSPSTTRLQVDWIVVCVDRPDKEANATVHYYPNMLNVDDVEQTYT